MPRVGVTATNTTLDTGREFSGQTVQPQNQTVFGLNAALPIGAGAMGGQDAGDGPGGDCASVGDRRATPDRGGDGLRVSGGDRPEAPGRRHHDGDRNRARPARLQHQAPRGRRRQPPERAAFVAGAVIGRSAARSVAAVGGARAGGARRAARCQWTGRRQRRAGVRDPAGGSRKRVAAEPPRREGVDRRTRRERTGRQRQQQGLVARRVGLVRTAGADAVRHLPAVAHVVVVAAAGAADLRRRRSGAAYAVNASRSSRRRS